MRSIPCLHKRPLGLVRIVLAADLLDPNLCAVFGKHDILLLHVLGAPLSQLVRVEEDLWGACLSEPSRDSAIGNLPGSPSIPGHRRLRKVSQAVGGL